MDERAPPSLTQPPLSPSLPSPSQPPPNKIISFQTTLLIHPTKSKRHRQVPASGAAGLEGRPSATLDQFWVWISSVGEVVGWRAGVGGGVLEGCAGGLGGLGYC
jgi:hypothetical protein